MIARKMWYSPHYACTCCDPHFESGFSTCTPTSALPRPCVATQNPEPVVKTPSSAHKSRAGESKLGQKSLGKRLSRRLRQDLYSVDNVVLLRGSTKHSGMQLWEQGQPQCLPKIYTPEYRVIHSCEWELLEPQDAEQSEAESDLDEHYATLHKPYEIAEMCNRCLSHGGELPPGWNTGLKVRIRLPTTPGHFPSLLS